MRDLRADLESRGAGAAEQNLAALEARELRRYTTQLWWKVARHFLRGLLGVAPMALAFMPRFRIGAVAWLLPPLAIYVLVEVRQAVSTYRDLQTARRSLRRSSPSDAAGLARQQDVPAARNGRGG